MFLVQNQSKYEMLELSNQIHEIVLTDEIMEYNQILVIEKMDNEHHEEKFLDFNVYFIWNRVL
jgi:hypothetical protein